MRKITLAAAVAILLTGAASAADMAPRYAKAPPPLPVAVYNWTGFYIGAHGGGAWGNSDWVNTNSSAINGFWPDLLTGDRNGHRISGALGGGQAGYNFQSGAFVYGLELSGSAADIKGSSIGQPGPISGQDDLFTTKISALFLASARLGYAVNNWLLYAKGGYAGASVKTSAVDAVPAATGAGYAKNWHNGWNVGAGVEVGFTPNWSFAVQYDYVQLETKSAALGGTTFLFGFPVGTSIYDWNINPDIHAVTARINYRFGGPVVAKY